MFNNLSKIDPIIVYNALSTITIPENINFSRSILDEQFEKIMTLMNNSFNNDEKIDFIQRNIKFIKKCTINKPIIWASIVNWLQSQSSIANFIDNFFPIKDLQMHVNNFVKFKGILISLEKLPHLQKEFFNFFEEKGLSSLVLHNNDFVSAITLLAESQKNKLINECDFSKVFKTDEDLLSIMEQLSKEEFLGLLKNKKFLDNITDNMILYVINDYVLEHIKDKQKLLSQFFDILINKGKFNIHTFKENMRILPEVQRYSFLLQPRIQGLLHNSIKNSSDFVEIVKTIHSNEQQHEFLLKCFNGNLKILSEEQKHDFSSDPYICKLLPNSQKKYLH